jgi:hypothetical protein
MLLLLLLLSCFSAVTSAVFYSIWRSTPWRVDNLKKVISQSFTIEKCYSFSISENVVAPFLSHFCEVFNRPETKKHTIEIKIFSNLTADVFFNSWSELIKMKIMINLSYKLPRDFERAFVLIVFFLFFFVCLYVCLFVLSSSFTFSFVLCLLNKSLFLLFSVCVCWMQLH